MKIISYSIIFMALTILDLFGQSTTSLKLWYDSPAQNWNEALPLGNGRLGAMIFGNPGEDVYQLNESSVWGGGPHRNDNPEAIKVLSNVRELLFAGRYKEAQDIANEKIISQNSNGMPYQTVGNVQLSFPGHENFTDYYRELNIKDAVIYTAYKVDDVNYSRETFVSHPDQIIVSKISSDQNNKLSFSIAINRPSEIHLSTSPENELIMDGITGDCDSIKGKVKYEVRVKVVNVGGNIKMNSNSIVVSNANEATLYITIATNFIDYNNLGADPSLRNSEYLENALAKSYDELLTEHIKDYQEYFNRVDLNLGESEAIHKPTNVRIKEFTSTDDPQLVELYFQFGRYLLISSSRPGGQPANLQGIWNNQLYPPWDSKYTVNINTEMNYWPSETTNLTEMNEPLIQMIRELSQTGKETANNMYGADGWVLHHNTDIWRINGPVDGAYWGMWPMGGAWLSQHLFEKYLFNGDIEYLNSIYPIMRSAVEFYLSFLIEEPENHWLVVAPSVSPENAPSIHSDASISYGTTMDNQLLFDLFYKTKISAQKLNIDSELVSEIDGVLNKLPPMQIGKYGQLQEWIKDWDNPDDKHRHVSHLYGVFPSNQISPFRNPELFDAAKTSLIYRGDPSTGWSMNWKINLWAHFLDGNHAFKLMTDQISLVEDSDTRKGGTYANMFDAHPPFQIDGNFGFTSGVTEMLLQSSDGEIFILPALPDNWKNGEVKGLRARGGFEVEEMQWREGSISMVKIKSNLGGNCRIRSYSELRTEENIILQKAVGENKNQFFFVPNIKEPLKSDEARLNDIGVKNSFVYDIETASGKTYTFVKR